MFNIFTKMVNIKYPCKVCNKSCKSNQNCIFCDSCETWIHLKCTALTLSQFKSYSNNLNMPFFCENFILNNLPVDCLDFSLGHFEIPDSEKYIRMDNLNLHFEQSNYSMEDLIILHINTRSLTKNIDKVRELISLMPHQPDIVAITESKLGKSSNLDFVQVPGYDFLHNDSLTLAGGVAIFIKSQIRYKFIPDITFLSKNYESIWLELENSNNNDKSKNLLAGVIYRHPKYSIDTFSNELSNFLLQISQENKRICIAGDINIDALKQESNTTINDYFDMLHSFGFCNTIELPTRITEKSKTLIDHFYYNKSENEIYSSIILTDISDHFPVLATEKKSKSIFQQDAIYIRNYNKLNLDNFRTDLKLVVNNLDKDFNMNGTDKTLNKFDLFMQELVNMLNKHVPLQKLSRQQQRLKQRPWITSGILKSIRFKNKLYKQICKSKFKDQEMVNLYKQYRNKITHLKEISKQNH